MEPKDDVELNDKIDISNSSPNPLSANVQDDPFVMQTLPMVLQLHLVRKLDFRTYSKLVKCSKGVASACDRLGDFRYRHEVDKICVTAQEVLLNDYGNLVIPWNVIELSKAQLSAVAVEFQCPLKSERCQEIVETFRANGTTAERIEFQETVSCDADQLEELLNQLRVIEIRSTVNSFLRSEVLQLPYLQRCENIFSSKNEAGDRELLGLRGRELFLATDNVTARGINLFIREWKDGIRNVGECLLLFSISAGTREADEMIEGTGAVVRWSPETHDISEIGAIPLEAVRNGATIYSIQRDEDSESLLVQIWDHGVKITACDDAFDYPIFMIDNYQYYLLRSHCISCDAEFCVHFGRYSLGRLRRECPLVSFAVCRAARVAKYATALVRICYLPYIFDNPHFRYVVRRF